MHNSLLFSQDLQILRILVCVRLHRGSAVAREWGKDAFYPETQAILCSIQSCLSPSGIRTCALYMLPQCEKDISPSLAFILM